MITIESIQTHVAVAFDMRLIDMTSVRKPRCIARPRQVAMYLARQLFTSKLWYIGDKFGDRDRSTVHHAIRNIESLMASDPAFAARVDGIRSALELAP